MNLKELAERLGAELQGLDAAEAAQTVVKGCARLEDAGPDEVAFLANPRYQSHLKTSRAAVVIVSPAAAEEARRPVLVCDDPYYSFRNAMIALHGFREHPGPAGGDVSPLAVIDSSAQVGAGTQVHPFAVLGPDVRVGENCVIYPHVFIGRGSQVGSGCLLYPNVVIYDGCRLGDRVTLHAGCVIGQDGFGYATHAGAHHKIPQAGGVVIEDDVELGACCTVDRATLGDTVIGQGTKFSNQVAIGHGTHVGRHNLYVAQVGIAGSVETGDYVAMGGQAGVAGHLKIGSLVQIAAKAGVHSDIPDGQIWGGAPAAPFQETKRVFYHMARLPDLAARVKSLEKELQALKKRLESGQAGDALNR